jgi:hypothetical protein
MSRVTFPDIHPDDLADTLEGVLARLHTLEAAARAAMRACDRIDHDISYQTVICALVPAREWQALTALLEDA